jgi:hypothetical protein
MVTQGRPLVTNSTARDTHMPHRLSWTSTWEHLSFWAPRSVHTGNRLFIFRLVYGGLNSEIMQDHSLQVDWHSSSASRR